MLPPSAGFEGDPQAVLQTIRRYVHTFFGCKECGDHFEEMARESMGSVKTSDQAILWLWEKHNLVNSRLAGEQKPRCPTCAWVWGQCLSGGACGWQCCEGINGPDLRAHPLAPGRDACPGRTVS